MQNLNLKFDTCWSLTVGHLKKKFCITGSNNRSDVTKKKNGAHYSDPNSLVTASEYAFG
jgi:hypothetical protein